MIGAAIATDRPRAERHLAEQVQVEQRQRRKREREGLRDRQRSLRVVQDRQRDQRSEEHEHQHRAGVVEPLADAEPDDGDRHQAPHQHG